MEDLMRLGVIMEILHERSPLGFTINKVQKADGHRFVVSVVRHEGEDATGIPMTSLYAAIKNVLCKEPSNAQ